MEKGLFFWCGPVAEEAQKCARFEVRLVQAGQGGPNLLSWENHEAEATRPLLVNEK